MLCQGTRLPLSSACTGILVTRPTPKPLHPPKPCVPAPSGCSWLGAPSFSLTSDPLLSTVTSSRIMMRLRSKGAVLCNQWNQTSLIFTTGLRSSLRVLQTAVHGQGCSKKKLGGFKLDQLLRSDSAVRQSIQLRQPSSTSLHRQGLKKQLLRSNSTTRQSIQLRQPSSTFLLHCSFLGSDDPPPNKNGNMECAGGICVKLCVESNAT